MCDTLDECKNNKCKAIDKLEELYGYMNDPPQWGSLISPLSKRSDIVKNADLYKNKQSFCHFPKDAQDSSHTIPARFKYGTVPKTLVCHDMKNGYLDDSYVSGTDNYAAYSFYHWAAIDIFVYFSHHFITIPPLGWINVAHKHGVKILGTIITEWEDGVKLCEQFLESEEEINKFIHHLVVISKYFKLDGWLLNIENAVKKIDMMLKFVEYFTNKMHQEIPGSIVIWYDSVTNDGRLQWQNCLNEKNREFFDICDGIFTNYCWGKDHLRNCVTNAGHRKHDIFVGVDVWGRNFIGGGMFNTAKAVQEIFDFDLSMAIFAPAWTHEGIRFVEMMNQQDLAEHSDDKIFSCVKKLLSLNRKNDSEDRDFFRQCSIREHFMLRENSFWHTLWPYLNIRGPSQLPFHTFFCQGSGYEMRVEGEVHDKKWFNLRNQQYQLSVPVCSNSYILEIIEEKLKKAPSSSLPAPSSEKIVPETIISRATRDAIDVVLENVKDTKSKGCSALPADFKALNSTCQASATDELVVEESITKENVVNEEASPSDKYQITKYNVLPSESHKCVSFYYEDSFNGGGCLKISPLDSNFPIATRLFISEFLCDNNFILYYVVKKFDSAPEQDLNILLTLRHNRRGSIFNVTLTAGQKGGSPKAKRQRVIENVVHPINIDGDEFKNLQINLLSSHDNFYVPVDNSKNWIVRYYKLDYSNCTILEIGCEVTEITGAVLLGGLGIARDIVNF